MEVILAQKVETVINNKVVKWTDALVTEFCIKKKMFTPEICKGAVHEMGSVMIESVLYHYMDPDWVCPQLGQC